MKSAVESAYRVVFIAALSSAVYAVLMYLVISIVSIMDTDLAAFELPSEKKLAITIPT